MYIRVMAYLMRNFITILFLWLLLLGCLQTNPSQKESVKQNLNENLSKVDSSTVDQAMNKALYIDSMDAFSATYPIYFLTSGHFLNDSVKNLLVTQQIDTLNYIIELYIQQGGVWLKQSELKTADISIIHYYPTFHDFNFDGQKDIYIQVSASNGYVMSRGHVITVNKSNSAMVFHPEVRNEANLTADPATKLVISEEYISCTNPPYPDVCKKRLKWTQNRLVFKSRKCPCN